MQNALSPQDALKQYQQALLQNPKDLEAQLNCGNLCIELQRFEEAAGYFRRLVRVLKTNQYVRNALCFSLESLGNQAQNNGQFVLAAGCFEEALEYQPGNAVYWYNLGNAQRELAKPVQALESFKKSIQFNPNDADAHNNLGNVQRELGKLDKAIASYERALALNPNLHHALVHLVHQKQHICDWLGLSTQIAEIRRLVREQPSAQISPFAFLALPSAIASEQKQCASNWANNMFGNLINTTSKNSAPISRMAISSDIGGLQGMSNKDNVKAKVKIAYLSADFRLHPLAFLVTELIEKHDRSQFEIIAYSYGAVDSTLTRKRLAKAFDQFHDIRHLTDAAAAEKIRQDGIDILVDLTGFTQTSRTAIVAFKPAPININWLGYAGSMGEIAGEALFDYILVDKIIAPNDVLSSKDDFSEKLLYLPCYQPNDSQRPIGKSSTKTENNLPENAFVFCCFNQTFKITAEMFTVWMRILKQAPDSVLWLLDCNPWAKSNLLAAAASAGIANNRLIFALRVPIAEHLARHTHANLFLDTLPYNAHTTASDALFMDVPVLTCIGETMPSRVAASLLTLAGLPQFIASSLAEYEQKALYFFKNPTELTIQSNTSPLFNAEKFARDVEQQYLTIVAKLPQKLSV